MKLVLSIVQDDDDARRMLERDLRERFGAQYEIEAHADGLSALRAIDGHADDGLPVAAVFVADTGVCGGAELRTKVRDAHPRVRRIPSGSPASSHATNRATS